MKQQTDGRGTVRCRKLSGIIILNRQKTHIAAHAM